MDWKCESCGRIGTAIDGTDVQSDYHERVMTIARNLVQNRNQAKNSH